MNKRWLLEHSISHMFSRPLLWWGGERERGGSVTEGGDALLCLHSSPQGVDFTGLGDPSVHNGRSLWWLLIMVVTLRLVVLLIELV